MSESTEYDLIVIGSGPGGYVAAIRAAQLGLSTLVVEKDPQLGGTCLHRGCIPTKALLHTAALYEEMGTSARFGVELDARPRLNLTRAREYRTGVIDKNARGIEYLFRKNGIESIRGVGRLESANRVVVEPVDGEGAARTFNGRFVLLATGSVPAELGIAPTDGTRVIDSDQALQLERAPKTVAVLGGGAVGCEFASIYASFGARVVLVEMLEHLVPNEDQDVSIELERAFKARSIDVRLGARLASIEHRAGALALELEGSAEPVFSELLLVAVGRSAVISGLGLEQVGVTVERGRVVVDDHMQTSCANVYAIGDLVDSPWLAHVASAEGILAVEHMAGREVEPIDYDRVPSCTYCEPEVASVGLSESEARQRGHDVAVGKFPFSASGKAAILGHTRGFVKVVRETRYDEVLGVHIIGPRATDLIAEACVALRLETTTEELFRAIHAHPTLSEAVAEAAHAAVGAPIHI